MKIKELAQSGKSAYAIGKELDISKNTARRYMQAGVTIPVEVCRSSKLDPYKPLLHELMIDGIYNCIVLLDRIKGAGYDGGISILKDYIHPFRPPKKLPAVRRYETEPGKQGQMDWGICHYTDVGSVIHKVPVFVMVLSSSRAKYIEFASRCDLASLERCMVNAFIYFGGVPEKIKKIMTENPLCKRFSVFMDAGLSVKRQNIRRTIVYAKSSNLNPVLLLQYTPARIDSSHVIPKVAKNLLTHTRHIFLS